MTLFLSLMIRSPARVRTRVMRNGSYIFLISAALILLPACGTQAPEPSPNTRHCLYHGRRPGVRDLSGTDPRIIRRLRSTDSQLEGTRFTQACAIAPVCTPTRVGLMTGQYPERHRAGLSEPLRTAFKGEGLDPALPTLAPRLGDAGYHTGLVSKWPGT